MIRYTSALPNSRVAPAPVRSVKPVLSATQSRSRFNPDRDERLYQRLVSAASQGEQCPTNEQLCETVGFSKPHKVSTAITRLERKGRIKVTRYACTRMVEITETGQRTLALGKGEP